MRNPTSRTKTVPMRMHGAASHLAMAALITCVNVAFTCGDGEAVGAVMEPLITQVPEAIGAELLAIAELARYDVAVARMRWTAMMPELLLVSNA